MPANELRLRRGTRLQHNTFVGALGEVTVDTDGKTLRLHDGATPGGKVLDGPPRNTIYTSQVPGGLKQAWAECAEYTDIVITEMTSDITGLFSHDFNFGNGPFVSNTKKGIHLHGLIMPEVAADGRSLVRGTVVQGTVFNTAEGFEIYNCGVDVGMDVIANKYAGQFAEGLVLGATTSGASLVIQPLIRGVKADNVIALGGKPTGDSATWKHSILIENVQGYFGTIIGIGGVHPVVFKTVDTVALSVTAMGGTSDSFIFKKDTVNPCDRTTIVDLRVTSWTLDGEEQFAGPIIWQSDRPGSVPMDRCRVLNLHGNRFASVDCLRTIGASPNTNGGIGHLYIDSLVANAAMVNIGNDPGMVARFTIGTVDLIGGRTFQMGAGCQDVHIGTGTWTITAAPSVYVAEFNGSYSHGPILIRVNAGVTLGQAAVINRTGGTPNPDIIQVAGSNVRSISAMPQALTPASGFSGALTTDFGTPRAEVSWNQVVLGGVLQAAGSGTNPLIATMTAAPRKSMRAAAPRQNGGVLDFVQLEITNGGLVYATGPVAAGDLIFLTGVRFAQAV